MSVQATTWVWNHSQATEGAFVVLLALADHAHPDGTHAYPSVAAIAKMARLSERAVQYALRQLENFGEITITREGGGRGRTTEYRLAGMGAESAPFDAKRVQRDAERVQSATERVQPTAPEPINPIKTQSRARAREAAPPYHLDAVIESIKQRTGRTITHDWAAKIADLILDGRTVNDKITYLRRAIDAEPNPHQRFLPTSQPPPFDRDAAAEARRHRASAESIAGLVAATRAKLEVAETCYGSTP